MALFGEAVKPLGSSRKYIIHADYDSSQPHPTTCFLSAFLCVITKLWSASLLFLLSYPAFRSHPQEPSAKINAFFLGVLWVRVSYHSNRMVMDANARENCSSPEVWNILGFELRATSLSIWEFFLTTSQLYSVSQKPGIHFWTLEFLLTPLKEFQM